MLLVDLVSELGGTANRCRLGQKLHFIGFEAHKDRCLVLSGGTLAIRAKRGKMWGSFQTRENLYLVPNAGEPAALPSAGNLESVLKRGKIGEGYQMREDV